MEEKTLPVFGAASFELILRIDYLSSLSSLAGSVFASSG